MLYGVSKKHLERSKFYVELDHKEVVMRVILRDPDTNKTLACLWIRCTDDTDIVLSYQNDGITESTPECTVPGIVSIPLVGSIARAIKYAEASHTEDMTELGGHVSEQMRLV